MVFSPVLVKVSFSLHEENLFISKSYLKLLHQKVTGESSPPPLGATIACNRATWPSLFLFLQDMAPLQLPKLQLLRQSCHLLARSVMQATRSCYPLQPTAWHSS